MIHILGWSFMLRQTHYLKLSIDLYRTKNAYLIVSFCLRGNLLPLCCWHFKVEFLGLTTTKLNNLLVDSSAKQYRMALSDLSNPTSWSRGCICPQCTYSVLNNSWHWNCSLVYADACFSTHMSFCLNQDQFALGIASGL